MKMKELAETLGNFLKDDKLRTIINKAGIFFFFWVNVRKLEFCISNSGFFDECWM